MAVYDLKTLTGVIENERNRSKQYLQDAKERKKTQKTIETQVELSKMQIEASMDRLDVQIKENRLLNEDSKQENRYLKELELIANEIANDATQLINANNTLNTKIQSSSENLLAWDSISDENKTFSGEKLKTDTDDFRKNLINREKNQQAELDHRKKVLNDLNNVITKSVDFKNVFTTVNPKGKELTRNDLIRRGNEWLADNVENYHVDNPKHKLWTSIMQSNTSEFALMNLNSQIAKLEKPSLDNKLVQAKTELVNAQKKAENNPNSQETLKYKADLKKYKDLHVDNWTKGEHSTANVIKGFLSKISEGKHDAYNDFKDTYKDTLGEEYFENLEIQANAFFTALTDPDELYTSFVAKKYDILDTPINNGPTVGQMLFLDAYNVIKTGINDINNIGGFTDAPSVNYTSFKNTELTEQKLAKQKLIERGYKF